MMAVIGRGGVLLALTRRLLLVWYLVLWNLFVWVLYISMLEVCDSCVRVADARVVSWAGGSGGGGWT